MSKDRVLWHQSGVNCNGEPFVQLFLDEQPITQFTPDEARQFGLLFYESAEAAEQDAFMKEFFEKNLNATTEEAMKIIVAFRMWREAKGKKGPPSSPNEFMRTPQHKHPEPK